MSREPALPENNTPDSRYTLGGAGGGGVGAAGVGAAGL
jgi:hypothetical protein